MFEYSGKPSDTRRSDRTSGFLRRSESARPALRGSPGGTAPGRRDTASGRKSFRTLQDRVVADPERRERVEEFGRAYDAVLGLGNLREARGVTRMQVRATG